MENIVDTKEFQSLVDGDKLFCAVFSADWCPDCQVLKAVLPGIEEEYKDRFNFAVVDHDAFPELTERYDILGIPSFIVLRQGKIISTYISTHRKTRKQITEFLDGVED